MLSASATLRKVFGMESDTFSSTEENAVNRLANTHRKLQVEDGRLDMKSETGYSACSEFLEGLESCSSALGLEIAARSYRSNFTINYRALFPDESRSYRVDVLEASAEQYAVIWVNGDKFEFSAEAMRRAEALQRAWSDARTLLERWPHVSSRPSRADLRTALMQLDTAWASFEHKYICELIEIENKARQLIVQAIKYERSLQQLEAYHGKGEAVQRLPAYREEQGALVRCISKLNSVANVRRKGRDDLGVDILFGAVRTLHECDAAERRGESTDALSAARTLATDVVESFSALRTYFREVAQCLERVDPHLCNNVGLVSRLVDWEESWEVGLRYVQHPKLLTAVCDVIAEIRRAQRLVPALTSMCEDCDVELFLVLPRIIWLRFLAEPGQLAPLLKSLLPHKFSETRGALSKSEAHMEVTDAEVKEFLDKFKRVKQMLMAGASIAYGSPADSAWTVLVKRVVLGPTEKEQVYSSLSAEHRTAIEPAVEDLMRELESHSIDLQRHCAEDWNQCSAILVQCLSSTGPKVNNSPFGV